MDDIEIIDLYWNRNEAAITATKEKYGAYLLRIAFHIVSQLSDSEECVNDTYLRAWNSMPPQKPAILQTYLGKLTRRIAIDRYRKNTSAKRGGGEIALSINELEECLPARTTMEQEVGLRWLSAAINDFLRTLSVEKRGASWKYRSLLNIRMDITSPRKLRPSAGKEAFTRSWQAKQMEREKP